MSFSAQNIRQARLHLQRSDPVMKLIIRRIGPFGLRLRRDRFLAVVHSIIGQQISSKAARTIWARLDQAVAPDRVSAQSLQGFDAARYRQIGISRQKAGYLADLTSKTSCGTIRWSELGRMQDEQVIGHLTQIKGVGRWTAQMFLIFSLGRLDVLPVDDLGIKSAIRTQYRLRSLPTADRITRLARPWRPFASVASWYLWQTLHTDGDA